ncbi:MAG: methionine adenosyltransferase [Oscillospiraceae bacterium]|nr:MAG: methionine adenosyltransferase [Oscillospiraceae bacterium]
MTEGHPDKVCDIISDSILDEMLRQDPLSRVACETFCTTGLVAIMGEVTTHADVDLQKVVRDAVREIGYTRAKFGFDCDSCAVISSIHEQSPDIAMGVDRSLEAKEGAGDGLDIGAGDQGLMFGYACNETPELMPLPIALSPRACQAAGDTAQVRRGGLPAPGRKKTQVTVEYRDGVPARVDTIVISTQHSPDAELSVIRQDMIDRVILPTVPGALLDEQTKIYVNPTGRFVIGGPAGDTGLTGRKIIVDTYGGYARHGGGAFSGKDPTKVDRSASYAARYVAKNIVAAGLADRCEVQVAYAIGVARPVSVLIDTAGTAVVPEEEITRAVLRHVDLRPAAIISRFDLRRPIYRPLAAYGHMGREDLNAPWEARDLAPVLRSDLL